LLVNADLALYHAKNQGRNRYELFTKKLHINSMHNKKIADDIRRGIELNEFITLYQPQYDTKTPSIVGVEALARWNHPEQGILYPDSFLKIADEINVTTPIDLAILTQTLDDFEHWSKSGLQIPKASVNVSLQRLHDEKLLTA
jgi:EAL domain-containing protein (putative c-di-GMP-specific phosphodiesterase class I)